VPAPNLTEHDAVARAELLEVASYDVELDLTDESGHPRSGTFRSTTVVHFRCRRPGGTTFIDLMAGRVHSVVLNGVALETGDFHQATGIRLPDLADDNELRIDADCTFTNTGEGLHRFVDPVDAEVYLYTQFETADAKRMYACFDQPDLKATFSLTVTAPSHWEVVSNARVESVEPKAGVPAKVVRFGTTKPVSTYVTALVAGPYHKASASHDGIDLGIYCRRTLAEHLDAEAIFEVTRQGFDWYHANFGYRYPFDKYDQLFVPEFNAGAMENAGCVTFLEDYVFRSKVTDASYERRAETILHEMAHMWFGDLVTMRWWDDLWLNESFATFVSVLCQTLATRWTGAWTTFVNLEKAWAYRQDSLPSTHPIVCDIPDVAAVDVNFDGITYAKGASVLKQLAARVGIDAFLAGVRSYFPRHEYGNTVLGDLLRALEESSGRDLSNWSAQWLETAGINTVHPEFTVDDEGRFSSFTLVQAARTDTATSNVLRDHRLAVGLYAGEAGSLVRVGRVELDVAGERTEVPELVGVPQPDLVIVNDDDLTYCKVRLDERSLATVVNRLSDLRESLPRALCWSAAWDMTRDGEFAARDFVRLVVGSIDAEDEIGVVQTLLRQALAAVVRFADSAWAPTGMQLLAAKALDSLRAAAPGSDYQLAWVRALAQSAEAGEHLDLLAGLLDGTEVVPGLDVDAELRWTLLHALVSAGRAGEAEIAAELIRDPTAAGERRGATARALVPIPEAKAEAWRRLVDDTSTPNAVQGALLAGFSDSRHLDLVEGYEAPYFAGVSQWWEQREGETGQRLVTGLYPAAVAQRVVDAADAFLAGAEPPPALRRLIVEGRAETVRALRARAFDRTAG
jgi:aminopeptidase N